MTSLKRAFSSGSPYAARPMLIWSVARSSFQGPAGGVPGASRKAAVRPGIGLRLDVLVSVEATRIEPYAQFCGLLVGDVLGGGGQGVATEMGRVVAAGTFASTLQPRVDAGAGLPGEQPACLRDFRQVGQLDDDHFGDRDEGELIALGDRHADPALVQVNVRPPDAERVPEPKASLEQDGQQQLFVSQVRSTPSHCGAISSSGSSRCWNSFAIVSGVAGLRGDLRLSLSFLMRR